MDVDASREFAKALGEIRHLPVAGTGEWTGLECEYALFEDGQQVDFAAHIAGVIACARVPCLRETELRYRRIDGLLILSDNWYVEFATPPERLGRCAPARLARAIEEAQTWFLELLAAYGARTGHIYTLRGVSTHFNVRIGGGVDVAEFAYGFARAYGALFAFLTCQPDTLSILIRPRPERLEIACDFVSDPRLLRATLAALLASVEAWSRGLSPFMLGDDQLAPSQIRGGWRIFVEAIAPDLRLTARAAMLNVNGEITTFANVLRGYNRALREWLDQTCAATDARALRAILLGRARAALELPPITGDIRAGARRLMPTQSTFRRALEMRSAGTWSFDPIFIDWNFVAFRATREHNALVVCVPYRFLDAFADSQSRDRTAALLDRFAQAPTDEVLSSVDQTSEPGLFSGIDASALSDQLQRVSSRKDKKKKVPVPSTGSHRIKVKILRLGPYFGEYAPHVDRPFYRRRTLEKQQGADLFLTPLDQPTFGTEFRAVVAVQKELAIDPRFTVRTYFSADLTQYQDFTGSPDVAVVKNTVLIDVKTSAPILAVHLIYIDYHKLLELPGHAVEVRIDPLAGASGAEDGGRLNIVRIVNLLLYEHDLGDAELGPTVRPLYGTDKIEIDLANGSLHLAVPLFKWEGRGLSLECELHYNSFHAAQMEAVERMGRINGVSPEELELHYARTLAGYGWQYTYGMYVNDYVLSEDGAHLRRRNELVSADGNHIQFEEDREFGSGPGRFLPIGRGTFFNGDPVIGASLVLVRGGHSPYNITDLYGNRWTFDAQGRLTEIASRQSLASGGRLAPIVVTQSAGSTMVKDTAGRTLTATIGPRFRVSSLRDSNGRTWTLAPGPRAQLLGEIQWPRGTGEPQYKTTLGYDGTYNFIVSLTNRRRFESTAHYVPSGDSWGKSDRVERLGVRWSAHYDPITSDNCTATATDARGTQRRYTWHRNSLAPIREEAYRPQIDDPFGSRPATWVQLHFNEFYPEPRLGSGKLITRHVDLNKREWTTTYTASPDGRAYLPQIESIDGLQLYSYDYHRATNRVFHRTDFAQRVTTYAYDAYGNQQKVTYPLLSGQAASDQCYEQWTYDAGGYLREFRDRAGRTTTFGYLEGGRDPAGVGLATSRTYGGLTWEYAYWPSGMVQWAREPLYWGRADYDYDILDRVHEVKLPETQVLDGTGVATAKNARGGWIITYDPNGNVLGREIPLGGTQTLTYDEQDRLSTETTSDGVERFEQYDGCGTLLRHTDRRNKTWITTADFLGRPRIVVHPATDAGMLGEVFRYSDEDGDSVRYVFGPYDPATMQLSYPRRYCFTDYDAHGNAIYERRWTGIADHQDGPEARWQHDRDRYGNLTEFTLWYNNFDPNRYRYRQTFGLDEWYRTKSVTVAAAVTEYELDPLDYIVAMTAPRHDASNRSTWRFGYDAHYRPTTVTDPYGVVVRDTKYVDATATSPALVQHLGIALDAVGSTPLQERTGSTTLSLQRAVTFNARGQETEEHFLDSTPTQFYYNVRGWEVLRVQGKTSVATTYDPQGRPRIMTSVDRVTSTTTELRYDEVGNQTYLSGADFSAEYSYDALDRFKEEYRTPSGGKRAMFRSVDYDIFGRVKEKRLSDGRTVSYAYNEDLLEASYEVKRGTTVLASVSTLYHWNGQVMLYHRYEGGKEVVSLQTTTPDRYGRIHEVTTQCTNSRGYLLSATVKTRFFPAGTRRSQTITVFPFVAGDPNQVLRRTYEYYADWQVQRMISNVTGTYEFRYQPNGCLSSWKNPSGAEFVLGYDPFGSIAAIEARRPGSATEKYLQADATIYPAGSPAALKQHMTNIRWFHTANEFPSGGQTFYATDATYDARTLLQTLHIRRTGFVPTGAPAPLPAGGIAPVGASNPQPRIERTITNTYVPDGSLDTSNEKHEFFRIVGGVQQSAAAPFTASLTRNKISNTETITSDAAQGIAAVEASIEEQHSWTQVSEFDDFGRATQLIAHTLLSPDVFHLVGDPRRWMHSYTTISRDELGRVDSYSTSVTRSNYTDPLGEGLPGNWVSGALDDLSGGILSLSGLAGTVQDTGISNDVHFYHGPQGEILARAVAAQMKDDQGNPRTYRDANLFIYDGSQLVAEIGDDGRFLRAYECGPGQDFRLTVIRERELAGQTSYVADEYLYGPGLTSLALAGPKALGGTIETGKVVAHFVTQDMPTPGDDRFERLHIDEPEEEHLLQASSSLYVANAQPARTSLPPGVGTERAVVGSEDLVDRNNPSTGLASLNLGLSEDVHERDAPAVDPADMPGPPPPDKSMGARLFSIVDWIMSWNPIWKLNKSKMLVKQGRYDEAKSEVVAATWQIVNWVLFQPFDPESALLRPSIVDDVFAVKTWYDNIQMLLSIPQTLALINGYDPETGAAFSWEDRLLGLIPPPDPSSRTASRGEPRVSSGEGCFPADVLVWSESGPRPIAEIWPGERVHTSGVAGRALCAVADIHVHRAPTLRIIAGSETLDVTAAQPLLVCGRGFCRADELTVGDSLVDADDRTYRIRTIETGTTRVVYNLSVAQGETYLVGRSRFVAHNKPSLKREQWLARLAQERAELQLFALVHWHIRDKRAWELSPRARGTLIEDILAETSYKTWAHLGATLSGFSSTYDFVRVQRHANGEREAKIVSLKTIDPRGTPKVFNDMGKPVLHGGMTQAQLHTKIDDYIDHVIKKKVTKPRGAERILHVVLPREVWQKRSIYFARGSIRRLRARARAGGVWLHITGF